MRQLILSLLAAWSILVGLAGAASPTPVAILSATPSPSATPPTVEGFSVQFHPDGGLFAGDLVSFEVLGPQKMDMDKKNVRVQVDGPSGPTLGPAEFHPSQVPGRWQATLTWAWDTRGLVPGPHTLTFIVFPGDLSWTQTVTLEPASALPPPGLQAAWQTAQTSCCTLHYISGTAAARDLPQLEQIANEQAAQVEDQFHTQLNTSIPITFIPRVLGQGGFTSNEIIVSYLDRDYAGSTIAQVLHHEMVHFVDSKLGGDLKPTLLVEGLATYLSGGHFKPEWLPLQVNALLDLGWYLPLPLLADNFYPSQHEIGYLEGGAFIQYLVETYSWENYYNFYRDIHPQQGDSQAKALDAALQVHFGKDLAEMEFAFITWLGQHPDLPEMRTDVSLSTGYYDTMRRYQQVLDPSAYFRAVWLPDPEEMMRKKIVGDYLRHTDEPQNQALETLLISAEHALRQGDYPNAERRLSAVNAVLNRIENGAPDPFQADPLAQAQLALVMTLDRCGAEPQQINLDGRTGQALVIPQAGWPGLLSLDLALGPSGWVPAGGCPM